MGKTEGPTIPATDSFFRILHLVGLLGDRDFGRRGEEKQGNIKPQSKYYSVLISPLFKIRWDVHSSSLYRQIIFRMGGWERREEERQ